VSIAGAHKIGEPEWKYNWFNLTVLIHVSDSLPILNAGAQEYYSLDSPFWDQPP
jgi:hypothetical protein